MPSAPLLTKEELDFIQNVQGSHQLDTPVPTPSLLVDGGAQVKALLTRFAAHEQLSIEAHFDGQRMTFPLQLVEDEFHALHLELGAPEIFDEGPIDRPWRLSLKNPLALLDKNGAETALWVQELSPNGMLVDIRNLNKPPKRFALWLALPEQKPIALRGALVRSAEQHLAAYQLSMRHSGDSERLRQFLFQQHRLLHPSAETAGGA